MHIEPVQIEAAYELLRTVPPFRGWHLPPADEVEFNVTGHRDRAADHRCIDGTHVVQVSLYHIDTLDGLLRALAHELCHMHQRRAAPRDTSVHGRRFGRYATSINAVHDWEIGPEHVAFPNDV